MAGDDDKAMMRTQHRAFVLVTGVCAVLGVVWWGGYAERAGAGRLDPGEERINPNTAEAASLMRLPNIGPARAEAIIAYRMSVAGDRPAFEKPEDMEKVKGIGPKTVERMRPWLRFD